MQTSANPQPTRFQEWLQGELDARDWTQAKLGREINMFKGTVGRWLFPPNHERFRVPSYDALRRLADLFSVDIQFLMEAVGIDTFGNEDDLSDIQRKCIASVGLLSDDVLENLRSDARAP